MAPGTKENEDMAQSREDKIRPGARKYGHVSVFSPKRVRDMAAYR